MGVVIAMNNTCYDVHAAEECAGWVEDGECDANPDWMHQNCRRSCFLCPDQTSLTMWIGFNVCACALLLLDVRVNASPSQPVRNAVLWSVVWIAFALAFAGFLAVNKGPDTASTFLVGYVVEKVLSVDNLLVIMLIFKSFK